MALTYVDSKFLMLSRDKNTDDVWCIDSRGIVTIFLSKETYEQLGIVGKPLPFKKRVKHERGTNKISLLYTVTNCSRLIA